MPREGEPATAPGHTAEAAGANPAPARRRRLRGLIALCCTLVAAALVVGAAGIRSADADENVLRGFQIRVLSISQAAAENRMDGALAALQALEKDLGDAAAAGRLSAARYRGIETALSAVKSDLATKVAAAAAPPAPEPGAAAPAPSDSTPLADTDQSGPVPAPVEPAVPAVAPAPEPAADVPGDQRSDTAKEAKDKNKGKGQGKP
ncbi:hypothetical protein LFT44_09675 [Arthrobacter sp. FW306-05-C]|uniref:hypothetical protein n=1 Tax=unclassified Arthrobacter TaxID=235627 RepID=UPI001EF07017|nr:MULTISPECIES: hypothetical protein [unclassified Arthrobacter]UKA68625.1 hypothetical protein LFT44_09675 [Arthrobacter sp. FW306-05-C]UKA77259.1 hypothetical protein LFT46_09675 [Arthrobacter sp. FW306-07-I]